MVYFCYTNSNFLLQSGLRSFQSWPQLGLKTRVTLWEFHTVSGLILNRILMQHHPISYSLDSTKKWFAGESIHPLDPCIGNFPIVLPRNGGLIHVSDMLVHTISTSSWFSNTLWQSNMAMGDSHVNRGFNG